MPATPRRSSRIAAASASRSVVSSSDGRATQKQRFATPKPKSNKQKSIAQTQQHDSPIKMLQRHMKERDGRLWAAESHWHVSQLLGITIAACIVYCVNAYANTTFRVLMTCYIVGMLALLWSLTKYVLNVNSRQQVRVQTISELCRKTDTWAHKCLCILAVGSGSLLTGVYYVLVVQVPSSVSLRLNLVGSMMLLCTGIFPVASPEADVEDRKLNHNPGSTKSSQVAIRVYEGAREAWINDSVSSVLHTSGIAAYVVLSLAADLLIRRYLLVVVAGVAMLAFIVAKTTKRPSLSVLTEALLVTIVVLSHAADVYVLTHNNMAGGGVAEISTSTTTNAPLYASSHRWQTYGYLDQAQFSSLFSGQGDGWQLWK